MLLDLPTVSILLEKHGIFVLEVGFFLRQDDLATLMRGADAQRLLALLREIVQTSNELRTHVAPRYRFDERWRDLSACLKLDGYSIHNGDLAPIDPAIEAVAAVEDDLYREMNNLGLEGRDEIWTAMQNSGEAFRRNPPDYNACLANARVALQTTARNISRLRQAPRPANFDETSWGQVLAYLRTADLITVDEETGLAGVFRFVSPGAHRPVGLEEQELARLGRSMAASMCYFLVKQQIANP